MLIQPKVLTVIMVGEDDPTDIYATVRSVEKMRYRNHEIVAIVPYQLPIRKRLRQDFAWLPLITNPQFTVNTLLETVIERGRYSNVDAFCFIQSGAIVEENLLHQLTDHFRANANTSLFFAGTMRADDSVILGAIAWGKWPYQLKSVRQEFSSEIIAKGLIGIGPVCLVRASTVFKVKPSEMTETMTLFYWFREMAAGGAVSVSLTDCFVRFNGALITDLAEKQIVPAALYNDMMRFIEHNGKWYDKLGFWLRYAWKRDRALQHSWQNDLAREHASK